MCYIKSIYNMYSIESIIVDGLTASEMANIKMVTKATWSCPADGMVHPWLYKGKQYLRNSDNEVWLKGEDGGCGEWQGMYQTECDIIDNSITEPVFDDDDDNDDDDDDDDNDDDDNDDEYVGATGNDEWSRGYRDGVKSERYNQLINSYYTTYTESLISINATLEIKVSVIVNGKHVSELSPKVYNINHDGRKWFAIPL